MSENNTKKDSFDFSIKKKTIKIVAIALSLVIIIVGLGVGLPLGLAAAKLNGTPSMEIWNAQANFSENAESVVTLTKKQDKDFVILNLTDIQMSEQYTIFQNNRNYKLVRELVDEVKPDLITLTGDNIWLFNTKAAANRLTKEMDKLGVPWAPVFGNHDAENDVDKNWLVEKFNESEHCLMKKGPVNVSGVGNYIINIKEEGTNKIVHTLFMMDSHMSKSYSEIDTVNVYDGANGVERVEPQSGTWEPETGLLTKNGYSFAPVLDENGDNAINAITKKPEYKVLGSGYDYVKESQIEWYKWAVNGIANLPNAAKNANGVVPSSVFMHIAVPEFAYAYSEYVKTITNADGSIKSVAELRTLEENGAVNFGCNFEEVCSPKYNSGFFAAMQDLKSTKNVVVGHDHVNFSSIMYKGIRLTYSLKTGDGCYWVEDGSVSGGTKITVAPSGDTVTNHVYKNFK